MSKVKSYYWEEINKRAYEEELTGLRQPEAHYALEEAHKHWSINYEMQSVQSKPKRLGT